MRAIIAIACLLSTAANADVTVSSAPPQAVLFSLAYRYCVSSAGCSGWRMIVTVGGKMTAERVDDDGVGATLDKQLHRKQVERLRAAFRSARFSHLRSSYDVSVEPDAETKIARTTLVYFDGRAPKTVSYEVTPSYSGVKDTFSIAPPRLLALDDAISSIVDLPALIAELDKQ